MDIFEKAGDLMTVVQDAVTNLEPLADDTNRLVKSTQELTSRAAGTLSNCDAVLADLAGLLRARTKCAELEVEKLKLEIEAAKKSG